MPPAIRTVTATRYVTPLREGGSLPGIVEADDDGLYVLKFRGAGQGAKALIAELVGGEIGRALGLPVPELVIVDLDPALGEAEADSEIRALITGSGGPNLGMDFLPGSLPFHPVVGPLPAPELAAATVWFDALITNVDRTPRNPNLLIWHKALWLIDHGASLYVHHTWRDPAAHARRPFVQIANHILLPFAGPIVEADAWLAPRLTEEVLTAIAALIPEDWLADRQTFTTPGEERHAYVDYLSGRLAGPRAWVEEAERARPT